MSLVACHRWQTVDEPTVAPPVGVWSGDGGVVEAEEEATDERVAARDAGGAPAAINETRERRAEHEKKPGQPRRRPD